MKENYIINIEGRMELDGESDLVQLMTRGSFIHKNGSYFISYKEPDDSGLAGNTTTVKVEQESKVSLLRFGAAPSQLVIECGKRHVCHYDSGHGVLSLGVAADEIQNRLTDAGGDVSFSYMLDSGQTQLSRNSVKITVQKTNDTGKMKQPLQERDGIL